MFSLQIVNAVKNPWSETVKPIKVMSPHLGNKSELTAQKIFNAYFNSYVEMYKIYFLLTW